MVYVFIPSYFLLFRYGDNYGWVTQGRVACDGTSFVGNVWGDVTDLDRRTCAGIGGKGAGDGVDGSGSGSGGNGGDGEGGEGSAGGRRLQLGDHNVYTSVGGGVGGGVGGEEEVSPPPEVHVMILWSNVPQTSAQHVMRYLLEGGGGGQGGGGGDGDLLRRGLRVADVWVVRPSDEDIPTSPSSPSSPPSSPPSPSSSSSTPQTGALTEEWYQQFYGDAYYTIFVDPAMYPGVRGVEVTPAGGAGAGEGDGNGGGGGGAVMRVNMTEHKGRGAFVVLMLEDAAPVHGHRDGKGVVSTKIYDLKHPLRGWVGRPRYGLHATQTAEEARGDAARLFGIDCGRGGGRRGVGGIGGAGGSEVGDGGSGGEGYGGGGDRKPVGGRRRVEWVEDVVRGSGRVVRYGTFRGGVVEEDLVPLL